MSNVILTYCIIIPGLSLTEMQLFFFRCYTHVYRVREKNSHKTRLRIYTNVIELSVTGAPRRRVFPTFPSPTTDSTTLICT